MNDERTITLSDGKKVKITIYPELNEAIIFNWESLAFSKGKDYFAKATMGNKSIILTTEGRVKFIRNKDERIFTNSDEDEIRLLLIDKLIEQPEFTMCENNWFSLIYLEDSVAFDDDVFEDVPKTKDEFATIFERIVRDYFTKNVNQ